MTNLTRNALAHVPLTEATVQSFYDLRRCAEISAQNLGSLCESHERLRIELAGSEVLRADAEKEIEALKTEIDELLLGRGRPAKYREASK